jgi:hypothetical protein
MRIANIEADLGSWLQRVFNVPLVVQITGEISIAAGVGKHLT